VLLGCNLSDFTQPVKTFPDRVFVYAIDVNPLYFTLELIHSPLRMNVPFIAHDGLGAE
jgi:hypothetical protein